MTQAKDPYSNQGDSRDTPSRQKLVGLREALLRIHKSLLDMERRGYEKEHGKVTAGELFRLVVDDPNSPGSTISPNLSCVSMKHSPVKKVSAKRIPTLRFPLRAKYLLRPKPVTVSRKNILTPSTRILPLSWSTRNLLASFTTNHSIGRPSSRGCL